MYRVGLTGGIASGKTTVSRQFATLGVPVIDSDEIAREVVEPGQPALQAIVARFGSEVLQTDGRLDRRRLRSLVFADPAARRDLEAITHPAIRAGMDRRRPRRGPCTRFWRSRCWSRAAAHRVDRVLVVDSPGRAAAAPRDGPGPEQRGARRRDRARRPSREARLAAADDVILNDGDLADLGRQVETLHQRYRMAAQAQAE